MKEIGIRKVKGLQLFFDHEYADAPSLNLKNALRVPLRV
jgi:hypothetical protein